MSRDRGSRIAGRRSWRRDRAKPSGRDSFRSRRVGSQNERPSALGDQRRVISQLYGVEVGLATLAYVLITAVLSASASRD
jgi:hypothetical protein